MFKVKLLLAHLDMWSISSKMVDELTDGIKRLKVISTLIQEIVKMYTYVVKFSSDAHII